MDATLGNRLRKLSGPTLVTGHTGFKGTWLTLLLERVGVPVIGLSLPPTPFSLYERAGRTRAIPEAFLDIREPNLVDAFLERYRPSAIFHMAAQPLVLESYKAPRETFSTNVMGTINILDAAFKTDFVESIVAVTTDKVYRNDNSGTKFKESDPLAGKDPYSASKVGTESAIAAWQQISKVSGGPKLAAVRAGNVIGGGDWAVDRLIPDLIRGFSTNSRVVVRNPKSTRPWQHVLDPVLGYVMAMEYMLAGNLITSMNFGPSDDSITVGEVVEIAKDCWPFPTSVEFAEQEQEEGIEAIALQLDSKLARSSLNWNCAWNQRESVTATIKWWDKVLSNSVIPAEACAFDIEFLLSRGRGLGIS